MSSDSDTVEDAIAQSRYSTQNSNSNLNDSDSNITRDFYSIQRDFEPDAYFQTVTANNATGGDHQQNHRTIFWHEHVYNKLTPKPTPHYIENILGIQSSSPRSSSPAVAPSESCSMSPRSDTRDYVANDLVSRDIVSIPIPVCPVPVPNRKRKLNIGSGPVIVSTVVPAPVSVVRVQTVQRGPVPVTTTTVPVPVPVTVPDVEPLNLSIKEETKVPLKIPPSKGNFFLLIYLNVTNQSNNQYTR